MAKFVSTSLTAPGRESGRGRQVVQDVARRYQSGADAVVRQADAAVAERQARISTIQDEDLKSSIGAVPGLRQALSG